MNLCRFRIPATIALSLGALVLISASAFGAPQGPPPPYYGQDRGGWDAPPQEWNEVQRRGFHDGIEGARKDFENHRQPDVDNRDEYRHPNIEPEFGEAYKEGFRHGYQAAMSHLMGGSPGQFSGPERPWDTPPDELNEVQRRGFHDGIEGAHRDFDNHRQPDVDNRDEYRQPNIEPEFREAYRDGFRRGYQLAMSHLMGEQGMQMRQPERPWDAPPDEWNEIQRQGFHDGVIGAQKDFGNHRRPDVNNRDEYRDPQLPREQRRPYREGFRHGYDRAMSHLMGDPDRR